MLRTAASKAAAQVVKAAETSVAESAYARTMFQASKVGIHAVESFSDFSWQQKNRVGDQFCQRY